MPHMFKKIKENMNIRENECIFKKEKLTFLEIKNTVSEVTLQKKRSATLTV